MCVCLFVCVCGVCLCACTQNCEWFAKSTGLLNVFFSCFVIDISIERDSVTVFFVCVCAVDCERCAKSTSLLNVVLVVLL